MSTPSKFSADTTASRTSQRNSVPPTSLTLVGFSRPTRRPSFYRDRDQSMVSPNALVDPSAKKIAALLSSSCAYLPLNLVGLPPEKSLLPCGVLASIDLWI